MDEAVRQAAQFDESWKKQQEHVTSLGVREASLTTEVVDLLKHNRELLETRTKDKTEVDALKKKL